MSSDVAATASRPVLILLCTYNEVRNLPRLIEQLQVAVPPADILVVDDDSPDGTGHWVRQQSASDPRLFLVSRSGKLGLGSATRQGLQWGLDRGYEFILNMDADFSHRPADAAELLATCQRTDCDLAVGSRYLAGGGFRGLPVHRRLMSWSLNRYTNWLLDLPLTDCSGSLRCYRARALRTIDLQTLSCPGYGFLEEILVALRRAGCSFVEVPVWFEPRLEGQSKLSAADAWGAVRVIHRLAFHTVRRGTSRD